MSSRRLSNQLWSTLYVGFGISILPGSVAISNQPMFRLGLVV